uniref:Patatin n=1 Tax=Quercus lobata TaxID=97700 RepID=A0A7N2KRT7_QUELO
MGLLGVDPRTIEALSRLPNDGLSSVRSGVVERVNLYKTGICPISLIPELLGMVDKAAEYGSVMCWVLSGRVVRITSPRYFGSPYKFVPIPVLPLYSDGIQDLPRTKLSSAASQNCFVLCMGIVRLFVMSLEGKIKFALCEDKVSKKIDGPEARIADYFDVIAGTSTGGLLTAMLTARNESKRPMYAAKDIKAFYFDNGPKIFPQDRNNSPFAQATKLIKAITGPKYDGKYLHSLLKEKLGNSQLRHTLTNVVIPNFDIKQLQPAIFSSYEVKNHAHFDALLSDICIGTSAAPTYFPAHNFDTKDSTGRVRKFNLIDGGVAANNPTLITLGEVTKEINRGSPKFISIKTADYGRFLVLSPGTGSAKVEEKYTAKEAARWALEIEWYTYVELLNSNKYSVTRIAFASYPLIMDIIFFTFKIPFALSSRLF